VLGMRLIIAVLFSLGLSSASANIIPDIEFANKVTKMIKTSLPEATVGVILQDLTTGDILYNYHGAKHFLPASTTKLFSAAAALKELGPNYRYETSLYYNKKGDLAVKFSGDPSLETKDLLALLQKLQALKIKTLQGSLYIDDSRFDGPLLGQGWTWDSMPWYYSAPVSAIIIDQNQMGITLTPAKTVDGVVKAKFTQELPGSKNPKLVAHIDGVTFADSENLCQLIVHVDEHNNVELGGCWPIGKNPLRLNLAVKNPRVQAQKLIKEALTKLGIKSPAKIKFAKTPASLNKIATHESEPLSVLLATILGDSNNLYAESLTKTLGAKKYGTGSFKTGVLAIKEILGQFADIDFAQARIIDGSGSSRYNLLTPLQLSKLLYSMHQDTKLGSYFRDSLAVSGVNGTLQNRFAAFETKPVMQAKTGTLNGVSALSGYITTRSNRQLIVTIMINHAVANSSELKNFEDELCYFFVEQL
jgi:D-alanyl-D-alanine carboxypeptidase/D-alanyl-D-alanine-endopeptidase (penicillin-binding protein 4)